MDMLLTGFDSKYLNTLYVDKNLTPPATAGDFDSLVTSIVHLHQQTQDFATKAVNVALTLRNWLIGLRIVDV